MQYFKEVKLDEHLLYATEIATLYNVRTYPSGKPAKGLISSLLNEYLELVGLDKDQLYYHTVSGYMVKVYSQQVYSLVMNKFFREIYLKYNKDDLYIEYEHKNRKYKITV